MSRRSFLQLVQDYASEVELDEGNPSSVDNQVGELARMVRDIRNANRDIQLFITDWHFRRKTDLVAATANGSNTLTISAPADTSIIAEYDTDSFWLDKTTNSPKKLDVLDYEEWRDQYNIGVQTSSQPDSVIVMPDKTLKCYPQSDGVYSITGDYFRTAVEFSASGGGAEYSVIPGDFHGLIVLWAQLYYSKREAAPEYSDGVKWELDYLMERLIINQAPDHHNSGRARSERRAVRVV